MEDPGHDWQFVEHIPVSDYSKLETCRWKCSKCKRTWTEFDRPDRDLRFFSTPTEGDSAQLMYSCDELILAGVMES
jgi:hypothetical protein